MPRNQLVRSRSKAVYHQRKIARQLETVKAAILTLKNIHDYRDLPEYAMLPVKCQYFIDGYVAAYWKLSEGYYSGS